ncbi:AMP-binding protein [Alteromonas sp. 5E99-2]|uniref:AMP-binding protein n=1 Tax=Alteromonas sp. 5E99-2 TaxID=2817683 RepID=UPI001A99A22E|nr:AMP-binding protein [Alteromonas sp. 5E99-2]MBO1255238.1 AMP-binding protein [Alteromonas sp. 5E99-2]
MSFWQLNANTSALACIAEDGRRVSYTQLQLAVEKKREALPAKRTLCAIRTQNTLATLINYLACLQSGHATILIEKSAPDAALLAIEKEYRPNVTLDEDTMTFSADCEHNLASELGLLLTTSGSTGTAKFVCLSFEALKENTSSICSYLPIKSTDTVLTTLPFSYSFGLSIVNTHLAKRACIVFNSASVMSPEFWQNVTTYNCTALYGVPFTFETLRRVGGLVKLPKSIRYLAQAGGYLNKQTKLLFHQHCESNNFEFYVMYGQTEATARIAYLPPEKLSQKPDAIGQAIPGGHLRLIDEGGKPVTSANIAGELVYEGPNIMLGYAESYRDLQFFSKLQTLPTGDLAFFDEEGDFTLQGRKKRIIKLNGERTNLDEVEAILGQTLGPIKVIGEDDKIHCFAEQNCGETSGKNELTAKHIATLLKFHPRVIEFTFVDCLPVLSNGKVDYTRLKTLC